MAVERADWVDVWICPTGYCIGVVDKLLLHGIACACRPCGLPQLYTLRSKKHMYDIYMSNLQTKG